ncbi:unnamed protein product [Rotaria sordida]|uniref:Uncharacterized protein n=1 Tax=Rotaria sordida TaxID=392033 RepID=A0A819VD88_9BILA|nr:unnamed protein product [Rotaria sordida]CAF0916205.1 unnamed protein product [Rotaria sordida]CAF0964960.1 unnamed protein product [Rotaria sordida]CAF1091386.1 unnamed protein product [Rotaria sordida]CAF1287693.1 unnamed protein product [Rotaria sordida]
MELVPYCYVIIDMDINDRYQFHIQQLTKPKSILSIKFKHNRHCTYEESDTESMMEIDDNKEDDNQFSDKDDINNLYQSASKRMKTSSKF